MQVGERVFVHFDAAQGCGVGVVRGSQKRMRVIMMVGRDDRDEVEVKPAQGGEGVGGDRARVTMTGMGGNDGDDLSHGFGYDRFVEKVIYAGSKFDRVGWVPRPCNG